MKKFNVFTLALVMLLGSIGYDAYRAYAATIILTNSSDTVDTFRTNVNTSLTNLNNGLSTGGIFTSQTWWQQNVSATSTALRLTGSPFSLFASSTAVFTNASTTQLGVSGSAWFTNITSSNLLTVGTAGLLSGIGTTTLTSSNSLLSLSNSPVVIGTSGAVLTFPLTKGNFIVGSDAGAAQATSTIFESSLGQVGIGTTTSQWALELASPTNSQLTLTGTGANLWSFREAGGNLYIGTSSPTTFATSTVSAVTIGTNGKIGIGSSTPWTTLSLGGITGLTAASSSIAVGEYSFGATGNIATSTAATIDVRTSNNIQWPIGTSATTLTLCNFVPGEHVRIRITNPNASAGAITWAVCAGEQLYWPGGTAPSQTTTANHWDNWFFDASATLSTASTTPGAVIISGGSNSY